LPPPAVARRDRRPVEGDEDLARQILGGAGVFSA
jgi:hypothetical protein